MIALLIDNEKQVRLGLRSQLELYCPEIDHIEEATGVTSGISMIHSYHPDIVFLDVEMDDGTGMDLLKQLGSFDFQLIFVTAHDHYAIDAFRFSAIDFLLKPVHVDDLISSINKAELQLKNKNLQKQVQVLNESLNTISLEHKKIVLRDKDSVYFVKVSEIIRCIAQGPYTEFVLTSNQKITISKSLREYVEMLEPYGFIRIHHAHLININRIKRFDKTDGGFIIMDNKDEIPVSKRKKDRLLEIISQI